MDGKKPPIIKFILATYGRAVIAKNGLSLTNETEANLCDGPYLILSNHVGVSDPIYFSSVFPKHIRWVAGAYLFKTKFQHMIFSDWCKAIPKQQGRSDPLLIRKIQKALKENDNVGLFPEGTRSWDGEMVSFDYKPLARMIKLLKTPVLFAHLEGGFAQQPRWSDFKREGKVTVNISHYITKQEIENTDLDELAEMTEKYLKFSNDEWKQNSDYSYKCSKRAEGLQRLFYMCPKCRSVSTIKTSGNEIICTDCGAKAVLDEKDDIISSDYSFTRLCQWHEWEKNEIGKLSEFAPEKGVLLQTGDANNEGTLTTVSNNITVHLKDNVLHVHDMNNNQRFELSLENITSFILNAKQTMELFCDGILYRIRLMPDASSIKYQEYYFDYSSKKSLKEKT